MTTKTVLPELVGTLASLSEHTQATIRAYGAACARTALQSPEIQALRKDAERLDWLDRVAHCADWVEEEPTKRVIRAHDAAEFQGDTWREAIDAAMQEQKP